MTAHDDAMPEDLADAQVFDDSGDFGTYPWDDDLYWINQREADDYRHERDDLEQ